jgi:hypothetical protein
MKKYMVSIERTDEEAEGSDLDRDLHKAFTLAELKGTYQILVEANAPDPSPVNVPADQLTAFFQGLRLTARRTLQLFEVLGVPSAASVITTWRLLSECTSDDQLIDAAIAKKIAMLDELDEALRTISGTLSEARDVQRSLDLATDNAEEIVNRAKRMESGRRG